MRNSPAAGSRDSSIFNSIRPGADMIATLPNAVGDNRDVMTDLSVCTRFAPRSKLGCADRAHVRQVGYTYRARGEMFVTGFDPLIQTPHAFVNSDARLPSGQPAEFTCICDVIALIGRSPVFETDRKITAVEFRQQIE